MEISSESFFQEFLHSIFQRDETRLSVIEEWSIGTRFHAGIYPSTDVLSLAKSIYVREDKSRKREKRCTVMASSGVVPVIIYEAQSAHITEITSPIRRTPPFPRRIYILSRMFRIAPCWPAIRKLFIYTILKFALSCQNFPIYWVGN